MQNNRLCLAILLVITLIAPWFPTPAQAAFDPNFIISDFDLTDHASMDLSEIFKFLQKRGILHLYVDPLTRISASQIIFDAANVYRINPKFLIALMQKEQSLVQDGTPTQKQYDWATGFAVCDDCSLDDPLIQKFKGFTNQITYAAKQMRKYLDQPEQFRMKTGQTYTIDGQLVIMTNDATRALYTYTPHLRGNQNFYNIWNMWFAKAYPDSTIALERESKKYYLIEDGKKRLFASKAVFLSRYNLEDAVAVSKSDLDKYPDGQTIKYADNTLLRSPKGTVYLVQNDRKRGFSSKEVLRRVGFSPEEIIKASQEELDSIPEDPPITEKSIYPTGALIQEKGLPGVYFVKDGVRHPIKFKELLALNFPKKKIIQVASAELASYREGDPIGLKNGLVVKSRDVDSIYFVSNGKLRPFASEKAFKDLGHDFRTVLTIPQSIIELHELGEPIEEMDS